MAGYSIPSFGRHRRRRALRRWSAAAAALVSAALIGTTAVLLTPAAQADQTTQANDNLRTAWDQNEPGLSPAMVQSSSFGQLFATKLDGQIYAQPLVVGGEVIAVTESNTMYGLDRATGAIEWSRNYGAAWPASAIGCGDLTPDVGATATPVYDPATGAVYFTTKVDDGTTTHRHPRWLMHAVSPTTGAELAGWPVTIAGSPSNDPSLTFDPFYEMQRPALLLMDGVVYAGFGAHCDAAPYRGYVVGVSTTQHAVTSMWATETGSSVTGAGVWQAGGGLVSDGSGRIFFSTGNGISPAPGPGTTAQGTLAESVVRLRVNADQSLSTADFFSPGNAATLDLNDQDISSGAPMALPDGFGTAQHPHLLVQQGKDGRVFLLDRDDLGGMGQGPSGGDAAVSVSGPYQGQWGHPAFFGGDGGYVYVVGNNGPLRALKYGVSDGTPVLTLTGQSQDTFGYTSGSPLVTSNGTDDSGALLWMVSAGNATGADGTLRAYDPIPDAQGRLALLWSAPIGTAAKFAAPAADDGKVYVGTRDGVLYGFGSPATTALTASPLDFGQVGVGSTGSAGLTLTATRNVSLTGLTASGPFSVTGPVPTAGQPTALAAHATLDVPVGFAPTATGGVNGVLTATLSDGQRLVFGLHGIGTRPGLAAAPGQLDFGEIPTGSTTTLNVQITNTGTDPETIDSVTTPSGPFTASGLPDAGTVVPVGGSFVATVAYTPTDSQNDSASLVITSDSGGATHTMTLPISGSAVTGQGHLEFSTGSLDFGPVAVGSSKTLSFTVTNTGNIPVTLTKAKAPTGDFTSPVPLSEGLVIGPDQTAEQSVMYTPRSAGALSASYEVTGTGVNADGSPQGAMYVNLTGSGTGTATTTAGNDGLWQANGTAVLTGDGGIQLTPAVDSLAGSAVCTRPVATDGLRATFTAQFGPGTGGDGMTLSLLDPAGATPTALGANAAGLGVGGQQGVVVALSTGWDSTVHMRNFVGIGYSKPGSSAISYLSAVKLASSLRQGRQQVDVQVSGGHVTVWVNGIQEVNAAPVLPPNALVAFSGATGTSSDVQTVSGLVVSGAPPVWTGYTPVPSARVMTTRSIGSHATYAVAVAGHDGVPANATSVLVDLGVSGTKAGTGAVTLEPHGTAVTPYGALYWNTAAQDLVASRVVRLSGGALDVYNRSTRSAPVYLDVLGYFAPKSGQRLTPATPDYALNTWQGVGAARAPVATHRTVSVLVRGRAGVPSGATSVVLNLAAPTPSGSGGFTVWPDGATRPGTPQLVWNSHGDRTSNQLTVPIGSDGRIDFYNSGTAAMNLVAVVEGYYSTAPAMSFVATNPSTLLDTRSGTSPPPADATLKLQAAGKGLVPAGATAVLLQVAAIPTTGAGCLTAWPDGTPRPTPCSPYWNIAHHYTTDTLIVPLSPTGALDLRNNSAHPVTTWGVVLGYWTS